MLGKLDVRKKMNNGLRIGEAEFIGMNVTQLDRKIETQGRKYEADNYEEVHTTYLERIQVDTKVWTVDTLDEIPDLFPGVPK
jgi:deoxyadenosine/deoxycytidine kinase